jgi:[ribosomal protein S5]-alanine N-acetyltransferase
MLPLKMPRLVHPPVVLRSFKSSDANLIALVADDPYIPLITTVPTSGIAEDVAAYIKRQHDRLVDQTGYSFAIANAENDEPVGQIGLWTSHISTGRASTGYWIAHRYRGRGYARAALEALSQWALSIDEIKRLELFVEPRNEGSWHAAEACSFEREGLLRSWQQVGDQREDMYVYSRIAT